MKRRGPLLRLPQSFIVFALMCAFGVAVISGGVAASQGPVADWAVFRWALLAAALVLVLWLSGIVDWIGEEELTEIEAEEYESSLTARILRRISRRMLTTLTLLAILFDALWEWGFHSYFDMDVPLPGGGYGTAIYGMTFGSVRLLGRVWSGVDLMFIVPMIVALLWILRAGFSRIIRANRGR
jgi:hypothetical protein